MATKLLNSYLQSCNIKKMKDTLQFILVVLTTIFITQSIYSQKNGGRPVGEDNEFTKLIPPSPTAYELGKYGQIPVGYFTGTPNVSVPLFTYKAGKLSVPISLSYNSNGIKVDQLSSNVGLGWSLNAGGVITRIVKDEPDEESYQYFPEEQMNSIYSPIAMEYFTIGANEGKDTEADVFMYNFMGHSGKFVYDNDKRIVLMPVKNLIIEPFSIENSDEFGYRITTPDGIEYEFSEIEKTSSFRHLQGKGRDGNIPLTTAWYLSSITNPTGDQVNFIYEYTTYNYDNSIVQYHKKSFFPLGGCSGGPSCTPYNDLYTYRNSSTITGRRISQIISNNAIYGSVNFGYNINHPDVENYKLISDLIVRDPNNSIKEDIKFDYLSTNKDRIFLTDLTFEDPTKQYNFEYIDPESLCERLSYSQDYWGYYNGANNTYFLPKITTHQLFIDSPYSGNREPVNEYAQKGLLKKITYPTKGFNEFEYETNTHFGEVIILPPKAELYLDVYAPEHGYYYDRDTTELIEFDHEAMIYSSVWWDNSAGCTSSSNLKASFYIKDLNTGEYINLFKFSGNVGWYSIGTTGTVFPDITNEFKAYFKENHTYEVILRVIRPCFRSQATIHYYEGDYETVEREIETGGTRIKRIIANDPITNNIDTTRYYYNEYGNLDESSGEIGSKGYYISTRIDRLECMIPCSYVDCEYYVLESNSFIPLFNTGNNNIYYEYVTVSKGGDNFRNGGETHKFKIHRDDRGYTLIGDGFTQSPASWTNFGWDNGLELSVRTFKIDNNVLKTVTLLTNHYVNDERRADTAYSYAITKNFETICDPSNLIHYCTEEDKNSFSERNYCNNTDPNHKHVWFMFIDETMCIASGANNVTEIVWHPCHPFPVGYPLPYPDALENLNVIEYMNLSSWNYLSNSTLHEYNTDNSGEIVKTTNYYYDNPQHLQISRIKKNESFGIIESQMYYPQDYNTSLFNGLLDKNIIVPIDQRIIKNNKLQSGTLIKYNDIGQPIEIHKAEEERGTSLIFNENLPYSYGELKKILEYNPNSNNLRSYKNDDDMETVILWGYNYSKPIAKIENATFDEILVALQIPYHELQTKTSNELKDIINGLREHVALENAMITSYTYDPLIGMRSMTDPNGFITHYIYDSFGRLRTTRDFDWNVIKHFDYNYQGPE